MWRAPRSLSSSARTRPDRPRDSGLLRLPPEQDVRRHSTPRRTRSPSSRTPRSKQAQAQLRALERSYFPRFYLQGAAYARGTGAEINGKNPGRLNGLAPNVQNYALGFTVTFPVSDLPSHSGPRGRANRHHPRAAGRAAADRDRPAGPMESRRGDAERCAPHRRQYARPGVGGAHRDAAGDGALSRPVSAPSTKSPTPSACSPSRKSTTPSPASPSGADCSASPPPPETFSPSSRRPSR